MVKVYIFFPFLLLQVRIPFPWWLKALTHKHKMSAGKKKKEGLQRIVSVRRKLSLRPLQFCSWKEGEKCLSSCNSAIHKVSCVCGGHGGGGGGEGDSVSSIGGSLASSTAPHIFLLCNARYSASFVASQKSDAGWVYTPISARLNLIFFLLPFL